MNKTSLLLILSLLLASLAMGASPESIYRVKLASFQGTTIITELVQTTGYLTSFLPNGNDYYSVELLDNQNVIYRRAIDFKDDAIITLPARSGADTLRIRDARGFIVTSADLSNVKVEPSLIAVEVPEQKQDLVPIVLALFVGFLIAAGLYMHLHPDKKGKKK